MCRVCRLLYPEELSWPFTYQIEESWTKPVSAARQSPGMTNSLGKAFCPLIKTSPMRSLWPDSGLCTSGPARRSRSPFCAHESPLLPLLPCFGQFPPGFQNFLINTVTFRVTCTCLDMRRFQQVFKGCPIISPIRNTYTHIFQLFQKRATVLLLNQPYPPAQHCILWQSGSLV